MTVASISSPDGARPMHRSLSGLQITAAELPH
jgi:hypothetical protein